LPLILAEKYKDELRRKHPAIPPYKNFKKWAAWGKSLMDIHINYETAEEYPVCLRRRAIPHDP
jgi:predicted helicase